MGLDRDREPHSSWRCRTGDKFRRNATPTRKRGAEDSPSGLAGNRPLSDAARLPQTPEGLMAKSKRLFNANLPYQLSTRFARRVIRTYPSARALNPRSGAGVWIIQANEGVLAQHKLQKTA